MTSCTHIHHTPLHTYTTHLYHTPTLHIHAQMVWEQHISVIVMLTQLMDMGLVSVCTHTHIHTHGRTQEHEMINRWIRVHDSF